MTIRKVNLGPAQCAVDLGDGSERGLYVNQDYILNRLHRPHRAINIMYCYYPLDETWPARAQDAYADREVNFAWDYPYDNYFPYKGGLGGSRDDEPFTCMRDIRRHGQDVILTLTCDPNIGAEQIAAIADDLRPFGRMMLRLNHECTGNWFSFTKRATYKEIADFFVKFKLIMAEHAPNVKMILCAGQSKSEAEPELDMEQDFMEAGRVTDYWSIDNYIALNWGWPYEVAEKNNLQHKLSDPAVIFEQMKATYHRYLKLYGESRPLVMSELNADGDVAGPYKQVELMKKFCELIRNDPEHCCSGFTMYQFRDDGRLGLEFTDPNNSDVGIEWPLLPAYRDIIADDFFRPSETVSEEVELPAVLRWGGSEDSEGIAVEFEIEGDPVFAEANFPNEIADANLMIEIEGRWFYKAPGVRFVDFMPLFYEKKFEKGHLLRINIFAPPATGENDPSQGDGWMTDYRYTLNALPEFRFRYEPIM